MGSSAYDSRIGQRRCSRLAGTCRPATRLGYAAHRGGYRRGEFLTLFQVAQSVAAFVPTLSNNLAGNDAGLLANALNSLSSFFATGDGVVPWHRRCPRAPTGPRAQRSASCSSRQPSDPAAISQILTQVDSLAGGAAGARTVLLLGPAFSDHTIWTALLADPSVHGTTAPYTNFNLRIPGLDPSAVDLTTITAQASWYSADLNDDGTGNLTSLTAQIGRLVARVQQLNGTQPRHSGCALDGRRRRAYIHRRQSDAGAGADHAGHAASWRFTAVPV